jgi:hypothetical protein
LQAREQRKIRSSGIQHNISQPDGKNAIGETKNSETAMKKG